MAELFYGFNGDDPKNGRIIEDMKVMAEKYHIQHKGDYRKGVFYKNGGDVLTLLTLVREYFKENPSHINFFKVIYFIENNLIMEDCVISLKELFKKKGIDFSKE